MSDFDDLLKRVEQDAAGLPEPPEHKPGLNGSGRNVDLTRFAGTLASQGRTLEDVEAGIDEANAEFSEPLPEREINSLKRQVRKWIKPDAGKMPEHLEDSDIGNGAHFADYVMGKVIFNATAKEWMFHNGVKFLYCERNEHEQFIPQVIDRMYAAAAKLSGDRRERRMKWLKRLSQRYSQMSMLEASKVHLSVTADQLDADPYLFGLRNGALDLKTGKFRPHNAFDLITKATSYDYNPAAQCPRFLAWLELIFEGDRDLMETLRRLIGSALTGRSHKEIFAIFWGKGSNGKSSLILVLTALFGDYARTAKPEIFGVDKFSQVKGWDIEPLKGARLVTAVETAQSRVLNENLVKAMSGGDVMNAERKFGHPFEFMPTWIPILATNYKPVVKGQNHAIWRRLALFPFEYQFPETNKVQNWAEDNLLPELPGILNWALTGLEEVETAGRLELGETVRKSTQVYKGDQDVLGEWLATCTQDDPDTETKLSDLLDSHQAYADQEHDRSLSRKQLREALEERGYRTHEGHARRRYVAGIKLQEAK